MAKIQLTPQELTSQSKEMLAIQQEYASISKKTVEILGNVNASWSENIANNFESKIVSAQKSLDEIETFLGIGATMALTSAKSFENIDTLLANEMKKNKGNLSLFGFVQNVINTAVSAVTSSNPGAINPTNVVEVPNSGAQAPVNPTSGASIPCCKPYTYADVSYKGNDYSGYEVLTNFDPAYCYNQHNYSKFNNASGKNVGCTATSDAIAASIHNGSAFDPNNEGWSSKGATWTNTVSLKTGGCSEADWYSTIYQQITSGNPVVARVTGHSVTVVGIRKGADPNNLTAADFLIADPADGKVKALSESRKIDTSWGLRVPK